MLNTDYGVFFGKETQRMPTIIRDKKNEGRGRKVKNIAGERFGHLVALEETAERFNGKVVWKCKCDCGNEIRITSHRLLHTEVSNCFDENCPYRDTTRKPLKEEDFQGQSRRETAAMDDLTGQVFGELTVEAMTGIKSGKNLQWFCRCSCGRQVKVYGRDLMRGVRVDCGTSQHRKQKILGVASGAASAKNAKVAKKPVAKGKK